MSNITVHCGINNPVCSPSRIFEIEKLDFENTTSRQPQNIETDVKLMYIVGQCKAVINDVYRTVAGITIVDNTAFYRVLDITKTVKHIEGFRPFNMPLDFVRIVNDYLYKTDNERAFSPQQWAKVVDVASKTILFAKDMLSDIFTEGISTVYDGDNRKLYIIPSKAVINLLGVSHDELKYGVSLHCDGEEVVIMSQEYENILLELKELCGLVKVENDDIELKIFANAVGIIAAFME